MASVSLNATPRSDRGTGAARKLRQSGLIPGIIYGHGREPEALAVVARDFDKMLAHIGASTSVVELTLGGRTARTLIREVQRHPFRRTVIHVDFQELVLGEKVTVNVPLRFIGTADGVRNSGGILEEVMHRVHLRLDPIDIPEHIDVDVTPLTVGHSFHVRDLPLPPGTEIMDDPHATVCVVSAPKTAEEPKPGEAAAGETGAEPELIRKTKADEDAEKK